MIISSNSWIAIANVQLSSIKWMQFMIFAYLNYYLTIGSEIIDWIVFISSNSLIAIANVQLSLILFDLIHNLLPI